VYESQNTTLFSFYYLSDKIFHSVLKHNKTHIIIPLSKELCLPKFLGDTLFLPSFSVRPYGCPSVLLIKLVRPLQVKLLVEFEPNFTGVSVPSLVVHITGTFGFAAQNGHQSLKWKNLVRPSQVKLLMGFQPNFTGVIRTIPSCAEYWHVPLCCTICPVLHRSNYWWDFNQTLQE
jgi:hypothetical protein